MHCASCKIAQWLYHNKRSVLTAIGLTPVVIWLTPIAIALTEANAQGAERWLELLKFGIIAALAITLGIMAGAFATVSVWLLFETRALKFHRKRGDDECEIINNVLPENMRARHLQAAEGS